MRAHTVTQSLRNRRTEERSWFSSEETAAVLENYAAATAHGTHTPARGERTSLVNSL